MISEKIPVETRRRVLESRKEQLLAQAAEFFSIALEIEAQEVPDEAAKKAEAEKHSAQYENTLRAVEAIEKQLNTLPKPKKSEAK